MITIRPAVFPDDAGVVRDLFQEYADTLEVNPASPEFDRELEELPGCYAEPRGLLLLALEEDVPSGVVGLRPRSEFEGELKGLYVRPSSRGHGVGTWLTVAVLDRARRLRYETVVLDTLPSMVAAHRLYEGLGFREIDPYRDNPVPGARFYRLALRGGTPRPFPGLRI